MRMRKGMRFRKRLSAAILAAVMMLSSMQIPGGTSYAAEVADDGITSGQTASILTEEGTEDTEAGAKNPTDEGAITDDESQTDNGNPAGGDNPTGDDSQTEDGNPSGDDSQTDHENGSEEEPDEGQVSDDDTEEPSEDTEEPGTEETEEAEAELKDIDQMDDMTSDAGGITTYAVSSDVKDYVYQQMLAKKDTISLYYNDYKLKFSDVEDLIYALLTEHPDLYFVRSYSSQTIDSDGVSYVRNLFINYIGGPMEEALNAKVDEALSLTAGMSDDVKAIVLHDYLAVNVKVSYNYHTPYYALVQGGVSEMGYALTYRYLLSKADIESYLVTSESMGHIWNMVKLDGKYYHVDVAMDDPKYDMVGRVKHDNLLRSDANLKDHSGWTIMSGSDTVNYKATDTKYENAFWVESTAPLVFDGNDCYYISNVDGSRGLRKASFSDITNTGTLVTEIDAWTVNPDAEGGIYSGLYMIDGRLFYNDQDSIYSIKPDGTDKRRMFTPEKTDDNRIYYSAYLNGEVVYVLQTAPSLSGSQTVLTAEIEGDGELIEEEKIYNIIYVLDGGTNDKDNPGTYTAETAAIILKDAVKEGYDFEGWYKDEAFKQKVTKISEGSTGNITLYAKFSKKGEGLNRENPAYEFYTLDDTIVTSTASGKPKILIFGRNQSGVENTLGNIKRELDKSDSPLHGVDIYLIGTDSEKNNILNLSMSHRSNEIVYTYDKDSNNENIQKEYKQLAAPGGGSQNPTIAYIDENNNLQYVYSGISASTGNAPTAAEIIEALKEYCNYKCYAITYELDGGTNSSKNPAMYTAQTETITLAAAVRAGYAFEGWYSDAEFNELVTEIVKGSRGDLTLYAKWRDISDLDIYRITYELNGGTNSDNNPDTYTPETETIVLEDATHNNLNMKFQGWYKDAEFKEKVTQIPQGSTGDITLYAKWKKMGEGWGLANPYETLTALDGTTISTRADGRPKLLVFSSFAEGRYGSTGRVKNIRDDISSFEGVDIYVIDFDLSPWERVNEVREEYGCDEMTFAYDDKSGHAQYVLAEYLYVAGIPSSGFIPPVICYIDGDNVLQYIQTGEEYSFATAYDIIENMNKYCYPSDTEGTFDIAYVLDGGTNHKDNPYTYTAETETIILQDAAKTNFTFEGWYSDAEFTEKVTQIPKGSEGDITLYAKWKRAAGKLGLNILNRGHALTTLDGETVSTDADGKPKVLIFYYPNSLISTNTNKNLRDHIKYFDGVDIYMVEYQGASKEDVAGFKENCGCDEITYCYDETGSTYFLYHEYAGLTQIDNLGTPLIIYIDSLNRIQYGECGGRNYTEILSNLVEYCGYRYGDTEGIYKITYELNGGTNDENNPGVYTADTATIVLQDALKAGYLFGGWYKDAEFTEKVTQIPKGSTGDITLYAKWERRMSAENPEYTLTTLDDETVSTRADGKPKILFFFKTDCGYCQGANQELRDHIKEFDGVDIYAVEAFLGKTKEEVAQFKNDYGCDEITYCYDKDGTNSTCVWDYIEMLNLDNYGQVNTPVIVYIDSKNRVQYGTAGERSWNQILADMQNYCGNDDFYWINYELNGGENNSENPEAYRSDGATIILMDPVRKGYIFEGWYKDAEFTEKVTRIPKGSTGDITLYAKWRAGAAPDDPDDPDNQDDTGVYRVVFDVQGHGTAPKTLADIKAGSNIDCPEEPTADGYRFDGWYKDAACTKPWDFGTDTVQSNLTIYAKWLGISSDSEFAVQEITDVYYNGKAQKPAVSVYDENTLLKAGKDYTLKYYNNTNANRDGVLKSETFNNALPYVEITGKGNYKETVKINFNILPASIGNDLSPAAGVTLKVNDQLVKAGKDQKPFGSIKYGRNMREGTDYTLKLQAVSVRDQNGTEINDTEYTGAKVPANYTGEFMLTVTGTGNYTGSISRKVYVADKEHLMKNVKITLGKDLKNIPYSGSEIELKAAAQAKPANDEFAVTYGKTVLEKDKDYEVTYNNNIGVGKAELVVTGKNGYVGSKTVTFNIKGKTFTNGTVEVTGLADQAYTGRAIVQDAVLTWKDGGKTLVYGEDYTVSYSKNINKGTATVTYTGKAAAGYSGKISKKFKITAANISEMTRAQSMDAISIPYTKAGVKPVDEIVLTNEKGIRLSNGKDYTLAYKNNKAVADASADKAPTVTVKGKGNYSGSFEVKFTIEHADLSEENKNITIECTQVMYNIKNKNKPDYVYKSTVTIKDGKTKLKAGTDYEIRYERNTHRDFGLYMMSSTAMKEKLKPVAVITAKEGSGYTLQEPLEVTLQIYYMDKLTKNNLEVEIGEAVYTGGQVRPEVTVWYWWNGERCEFTNYTLIYGTNTAAGKNKGSVTIKGLAPMYGGSVTYKFDIIGKDLKYGFAPVIDEK